MKIYSLFFLFSSKQPPGKFYKGHIIFALSILMLISSPLQAAEKQAYYISPNLLLGLHTKASLKSPIKALIKSGSTVERLKTKKDFSQIKTQKGVKGWVKTKFLTQDKPAQLTIKSLEKQLQQALQQKTPAFTQSETSGSTIHTMDVDSDTAIQACKKENKALTEELQAWQQLDIQDKQAQQIQAEKNALELEQRLHLISAIASGQEISPEQLKRNTQSQAIPFQESSQQTILSSLKKNYLILLLVSGVSFLLGIFVMDVYNRRRHGGYRV